MAQLCLSCNGQRQMAQTADDMTATEQRVGCFGLKPPSLSQGSLALTNTFPHRAKKESDTQSGRPLVRPQPGSNTCRTSAIWAISNFAVV